MRIACSQVCTDYLSAADRAMARAGLRLVDRQLAAAPLSSSEGRDYLAAMAAAANCECDNTWACGQNQQWQPMLLDALRLSPFSLN